MPNLNLSTQQTIFWQSTLTGLLNSDMKYYKQNAFLQSLQQQ